MTVTPVLAPVSGRAVALADVPDPVFSQGMVGWGAAVQPRAGLVDALAPVDGKLVRLMPHAYVVLTPGGVGLLVHLGLDTVALDGAGFTPLASQGDQLRA
ncbi:MAG TPA: PTS glucose transporter subunit IIA, partial [Mycolicibacterium fallax]|nr:PTS glucose transporter subunit IIA [Mycolicibacterium fallax]